VSRFSNQKEKVFIARRAMSVVELQKIHRSQADDRHNVMGKTIACAEDIIRETGN
jgi:hypothetical protein